jgi:hypothetical protein
MQRINIGKSPSRKTRYHRQHSVIGLRESTRSNRKASLYLAQKRFGPMAILCADDKSVISKYENVSFWRTGHFFFDFVS